MTPTRGPSDHEEVTILALIGSASPPDLEADLVLSDSTDSDMAPSVDEEIQLHREGRMSPGEWARTVIKTVWPIEFLFSSPEDRSPEEPQLEQDTGTQDPPSSVVQESPDQGSTLLVPYSPSSSSSSDTASSSGEDPRSQEPSVSDAITYIIIDLLSIAGNQDHFTSSKFLHTVETTHRELIFLLYTEGPGQGLPQGHSLEMFSTLHRGYRTRILS